MKKEIPAAVKQDRSGGLVPRRTVVLLWEGTREANQSHEKLIKSSGHSFRIIGWGLVGIKDAFPGLVRSSHPVDPPPRGNTHHVLSKVLGISPKLGGVGTDKPLIGSTYQATIFFSAIGSDTTLNV